MKNESSKRNLGTSNLGENTSVETWDDHTGKCIRRFGGSYVYCRYFIDRKW